MEKKKQIKIIPSEIIEYDILTRVSTETLVRFRCVCKNWSSLLSFRNNPLFNSLHSQRYNKSTSTGLIKDEDCALVFISHNDKKNRVMPVSIEYNYDRVNVIQSLNGLLIVRCNCTYHWRHYVYNPITNCSIMIPEPIKEYSSYHDYNFRLCYDPIIEKYKVMEITAIRRHDQIWKMKILTLGDGLRGDKCHGYFWRDIVVPAPGQHFCINGSLYWIVGWSSVKPYIFSIDITRESFYKIDIPAISVCFRDDPSLCEMRGLLCFSHYLTPTQELKIWTLKKKDHADGDEWSETFGINMKERMDNAPSYIWFRPLVILTVPKVKIIIASIYSTTRTYFSYDMESKEWELIHGQTTGCCHWHVNSIANW